MKTKAYKLAAELGLQEQSVLEWLRHNGYPNARRADTIRADVAQAARRELGRGDRNRRTSSNPAARRTQRNTGSHRNTERHRQPDRPRSNTSGGQRNSSELKVSFAELLESHLPNDAAVGKSAIPDTTATSPGMPALSPTSAPPKPVDDDASLRLARTERERDEAKAALDAMQRSYESLSQRNEALRNAAEEARAGDEQTEALRHQVERLQLERTTQRQRIEAVTDERATLEHTCTELQGEVTELRGELARFEQDGSEHESVVGDLDAAKQREDAWRARALELERAAQVGGNLSALLQEAGARDLRQQSRVLRALLETRDSAVALIRAVRQVDAQAIARLVARNVQRTCAHPVCNQVTGLDERVVLRVDHDADCEVCKGDPQHRWFARMVRECARGGVRRLLVVGGDGTHETLRGLSQGQPVDLRLVNDDDAVHAARVKGRIEGCDLLVLWSEGVVGAAVSAPYASAARDEGRAIVTVLGQRSAVVPLARAVCNRLARNHVLRAT